VTGRRHSTVLDRFWAKVDTSGECWLWTGATAGSANPYGYFQPGSSAQGPQVYAHRFAYEITYGPIPPGMQVDHVAERGCISQLCVRPEHLEAVTKTENLRRRRAARLAG